MARDLGPGVGDELLRAVDHPLAVLEPGAGPDVAGVGAGLGLGEPEGAELAPRAEVGQQLALLLLGAEQVDRLRAERGVRGHRDRDRGVDPGQLLDRERVGERVAAPAAVLLGERDPHQAELAHLRDQLVGERLRAVELLGDGRDLVAGEVADGVAQQPLLVGELEVHAAAQTTRLRRRATPPARRGPYSVYASRAVRRCPHFSQLPRSSTRPLAALVADQHRRARRLGEVAVAPVQHRDHHRPQVEALLGQEVLVAGRALLVGALFEDALLDQQRQPGGEDVAGHAEVLLDLVEAAAAVEDVADHEQGPALAQHLERAGDRADLVVLAIQHLCECRTLGCITQLVLVRSVSSSNQGRPRRSSMRIIDFGPIDVTFTDEEIIADLVYPAEGRGGRPVSRHDAERTRDAGTDHLAGPARERRRRGRDAGDRLHAQARRRRAAAAADRGAAEHAAGRGRARSRRLRGRARARSTTTRSASSTAATPRPCSTRRSAAPCTRRSSGARPTRPSASR